jgi:imidazolonepropionase-like amidohydrolase
MRRFWLTFIFLLATQVLASEPVAFVNVNVVPMSADTVLRQRTVVVHDGVIQAIGGVDGVPIPKDAKVIDGTDRFLVPGLAEMHAHVPATDSPELDRYFTLYVANGVTLVRGMLGRPSHLNLRAELAAGRVFGPRLVTSGPSLNGRSVNGPRHAEELVRQQFAAGYDFIKIHPGLNSAEFERLAATANELGMPFAGHVPVAAGIPKALEVGMATIDHLDGYFAALIPAESVGAGGYGGFFDVMLANDVVAERIVDIAKATAAAGTWNVPTEVLVDQLVDATPVSELKNRNDMQYMPRETVQRWVDAKNSQLAERDFDPEVAALGVALRHRLILELHRAGAGLLLGSDSPQIFNVPGFSVHNELDVLVAAGLTPYAALRSGTAAVARFLGTNIGVVEVGRDADLILLDANPLEDIRNMRRIHGVMLRGQWLPNSTLEERLDRYRSNHER